MPHLRLSTSTWTRLVVVGWLGGFAAIRAGSTEERDPYWQVRAGVESLQGVPLVRPDSWSWAPVDALFYPTSPGWNAVLGAAWRVAGFWGLFAISTAVLVAYFALAYLIGRRLGARPLPTLAALTAVIMLAFPMLSARATIAVQVELLAALSFPPWWRSRAARWNPMVNGLIAFVAGLTFASLGNWTHLSWLTLTPVVAFAWIISWLLDARLAPGFATRGALIVGGLTGLGLGLASSPYGVAAGLERTVQTQRICADIIVEWVSPFTSALPWRWPVNAILVVVLAGALGWWLMRRVRVHGLTGSNLAALSLAIVGLPAAFGGLLAIRFLAISVLTLAPLAAWAFTSVTDQAQRAAHGVRSPRWAATAQRWTSGNAWRIVLTLTWLVLSPGIALLGPVRHSVPTEASALATLPQGCRLFSLQGSAGAAILLRPDVPVWIDGRADYFGRQRLLDANRYFRGEGDTSVPPGTTCVLLPEPNAGGGAPLLSARLDTDPSWAYRGRIADFDVWLRST